MKVRMWLVPMALVVVALGVAVAFVQRSLTSQQTVQMPAADVAIETPPPPPSSPTQTTPSLPSAEVQTGDQPAPAKIPAQPEPVAAPPRAVANHSGNEPEPVPEQVAREALGYVGMDPDAEAVWITAINDPRTSPKARQNLIEDLNEDGFSDPHHVTIDDLPLIVSRLALIEELAPDAADEVNAAAFAEAYKDLANMFLRVTGQ